MQTRRIRSRILGSACLAVAASAAGALGAPAGAYAATACAPPVNGGYMTVSVANGTAVTVLRQGTQISIIANGVTTPCGPIADTVDIAVRPQNPDTVSSERVTISYAGGQLLGKDGLPITVHVALGAGVHDQLTLRGGAGADTLTYDSGGTGASVATLGGHVSISGVEQYGLAGSGGYDRLDGRLLGTNQPLRVDGGAGGDAIWGGAGNDTVYGASSTSSTGDGADTIQTGAGADRIFGGPGDDHLFAGVGDDELTGGIGADELRGAGGTDHLFAKDGIADLIIDGGPGESDTAEFDAGLDPAPINIP